MQKKPPQPDSGIWSWDRYKGWIKPLPAEYTINSGGTMIPSPTELSIREQRSRRYAIRKQEKREKGRER